MTTPRSHRPWRDRLRDTVDRVDNWINGPDDDLALAEWADFDIDAPDWDQPTVVIPKVTPNVDHTPPPPIVTHPECATLVDNWATKQAEADATAAWADDFHDWWDDQVYLLYGDLVLAMNRSEAKVRDYHEAAAQLR